MMEDKSHAAKYLHDLAFNKFVGMEVREIPIGWQKVYVLHRLNLLGSPIKEEERIGGHFRPECILGLTSAGWASPRSS